MLDRDEIRAVKSATHIQFGEMQKRQPAKHFNGDRSFLQGGTPFAKSLDELAFAHYVPRDRQSAYRIPHYRSPCGDRDYKKSFPEGHDRLCAIEWLVRLAVERCLRTPDPVVAAEHFMAAAEDYGTLVRSDLPLTHLVGQTR